MLNNFYDSGMLKWPMWITVEAPFLFNIVPPAVLWRMWKIVSQPMPVNRRYL
jgi:hypothetical protein